MTAASPASPASSEPIGARPASDPALAWPRRRARALAIVGGTVAALVVWVLAKYVADAELRGPQPGTSNVVDIGPTLVIISVAAWTLIGWGLLALLERFVARARTVWTWVAVVALLLSFTSPLLTPDLTAGTRVALSLMHLAVAAVVIPVFVRTSPRS